MSAANEESWIEIDDQLKAVRDEAVAASRDMPYYEGRMVRRIWWFAEGYCMGVDRELGLMS